MAAARRLTQAIERWPNWLFSAYAIFAAFGAYFSMYAYRKAFAAGAFAGGTEFWGVELGYKTLFVISQVLGYAASKFLGIRVISELPAARRALALVVLIGLAELSLLLFAVLPGSWGALAMVLNGLPLGMVWGVVFGFLEGRRTSEVLGAGLSASFIVASGAAKGIGKWLLDSGVSERTMPALVGALFFPAVLLFAWMLAQLPAPNAQDEAERSRRAPMNATERREFARSFGPGLLALVFLYVGLTALRDFRDNFAREIWDALGYADAPAVLAAAEVPVAIVALAAVVLLMLVRDNKRALLLVHGVLLAGVLLAAGATIAFQLGVLSPAAWMVLLGAGIYVAYVPYNCVLFDRLIAASGSVATAGFLIYVADSFGYVGSVALLLYKNFGEKSLPWVDFLANSSLVVGALGLLGYAYSARYFQQRFSENQG